MTGSHCRLFFDNFYTSPSLFAKLLESNLYAIGTIRTDSGDITVVKRTNKFGEKLDVNCPKAVKSYQTYMSGVDKHDMLVSYYIHDRKAYKYWHRIFFRIIEDMVVNSFICYSKETRGSLLDFKSSVATSLINSYCDQSKSKLTVNNNRSKKYVVFRNKLSNPAIVRQSNHGLHQIESLETSEM